MFVICEGVNPSLLANSTCETACILRRWTIRSPIFLSASDNILNRLFGMSKVYIKSFFKKSLALGNNIIYKQVEMTVQAASWMVPKASPDARFSLVFLKHFSRLVALAWGGPHQLPTIGKAQSVCRSIAPTKISASKRSAAGNGGFNVRRRVHIDAMRGLSSAHG